MKKITDQFLSFMGLTEEEEVIEEEYVDEDENAEESQGRRGKKAPVVSLHQQKQMKVVVMEPRVFEDVQAIADNLKNRKSVVVNLEKADKDTATRIVDFVSGTVYALGGSLQKVGTGIFLFVPNNVDIASVLPFDEANKEKTSIFTWVR